MTDRELLEAAAKAAGYGEVWSLDGQDATYVGKRYKLGNPVEYKVWNPLTDDGDALRLAVKLDIHIRFYRKHVDASLEVHGGDILAEHFTGGNKDAATRRAIVRAAAEMGGRDE